MLVGFPFWHYLYYIEFLKTVQDSLIVSIKFELAVVCVLSNGSVADSISTFCVALCTFVIGDRKEFKFDVRVECTSHSRRTTNCNWHGRHVIHF